MTNMEMDQKMREAIRLFVDNKHSIPEIIKRGWKQGLSEAQTRAGMVRVLERVQAGETIKPIRLVWQAWAEAKKVQSEDFMRYEKGRDELNKRIDNIKKKVKIGIGCVVASYALIAAGIWWYFL